MGISVRAGRKSDIGALATVLSDAFDGDPVLTWMFPDEEQCRVGMPRFFAALIRYHHLAGGGVEVAEGNHGTIGGASLWDPPGRWKHSRRSTWMMAPAMIRAFRGRRQASEEIYALLHAVHPAEPHWYLGTIGTGSEVRGQGYGQALLISRLERLDREHVPAYLESSKASNIPYYERFGFEVTGEVVVPGGGPTMYPMWRDPR
ncbi:GNAT family N-acetyltransferase [Rhodococcus sp. WMMA185]|uniref:GNAT family N-acetyltransferase n=1 Tax=Rhodococcus sp. WMMA185 TaxID=679318 RepID=UPI00087847F9|nr:GNAT family N-acetyltransferase [Rhodococcus sp. WMMA185]AOW92969.1 GNAT family N-acetyltransferase [Rhodococcus sp. WMMA185]